MGLISDDAIEEIRRRADIVRVVSRHVQLKKAGRNFKGLCPFHGEKTPSFSVSPDKGFFYCFGCHKKGDAFTFIMELEGRSFADAAEVLAAEFGVTIERAEESPDQRRARGERAQLLEINRLATRFFRGCLLDPSRGRRGQDYLRERGTTDEISEAFQLGYAPNDWHELATFLEQERVPVEQALTLGLVVRQQRAGGVYDRFRDRLVCPVVMPGGEIAGFSARVVGPSEDGKEPGAKYINSPESPVYKKSRLLFGLAQARESFRTTGRAILVEGNFDVLTLHQAGFTECVAPLGTALTGEQVEQLRRLSDEVILLYDGDRAGRIASFKALELFAEADVPVKIAPLPTGQDPDSLVREGGKEAMEALLARAQPGIEYFIYEVWAQSSRSSDEQARALRGAQRLLTKVANPTKRDLITGTLASAMGLDIATVRRALRRGPDSGGSESGSGTAPPAVRARPTSPPPSLELALLCILADHPSLLELAEKQDILSLLTDERLRDMYSAARAGHSMLAALPDGESQQIATSLLAGSYSSVKDPAHTLLEAVGQVIDERRKHHLRGVQDRVEEAQRRGDSELVRELVLEKRRIEDAQRRGDAALVRQLVTEKRNPTRQVD